MVLATICSGLNRIHPINKTTKTHIEEPSINYDLTFRSFSQKIKDMRMGRINMDCKTSKGCLSIHALS